MRILLMLLAFTLVPFHASAADNIEGFWLTQNERAVVEIEECGDSICGYVYWIIDGGLVYDQNNPDEARRTDPICCMQILKDFDKAGPGDWESGKIYKADDGDTYNANVELQDDGKLKLRGYVGAPLFGKTQLWTRVNKADYKACKKPS